MSLNNISSIRAPIPVYEIPEHGIGDRSASSGPDTYFPPILSLIPKPLPLVAPLFDGNIPVNPDLLFCRDPVSQERLRHLLSITPAEWGADISRGEVNNTRLYLRDETTVEDGESWKVAVAKITAVWDAPVDTVIRYLFTEPEAITRVLGIEKQLRLLFNADSGMDGNIPFNDNFLSPRIPIFGGNLLYLARNYHIRDGDTHYVWFENVNDRNWNLFSHDRLTKAGYEATLANYTTGFFSSDGSSTYPQRVVGSFVLRPNATDPRKTEAICVMEFNFGSWLFNKVNSLKWMARASLLPMAVNYNTLYTIPPR